jgi:hypothetical protein
VGILLGDFSAKVGKEDIFNWNESLHKIRKGNGIRLVNFATSKILQPKVRCSYIATSISIFVNISRWENAQSNLPYSGRYVKAFSVADVLSFSAADCDTDHYLVVANVWERQQWINKDNTYFIWRGSISRSQTSKEQYLVEVSNRFAA